MIQKITGVFAGIALFAISAFGQDAAQPASQSSAYPKFSINLPASYTFNEYTYFDGGKIKAAAAFQYGAGLEFFNSRYSSVEISYQRMDTKLSIYDGAGKEVNSKDNEGSLNYVLLGGNKYMSNGTGKSQKFVGGGLGVGIINYRGQSETNFAFNVKGGVKLPSKGALALKLHAYLQSMTATAGSDYWVSDGGTVLTYPNRLWLFQFGVGGALCFDFRN